MTIKPYYSEGGITIYHGDCRDILPEIERPDLIITDPPYGIRYTSYYRNPDQPRNLNAIIGDDGSLLETVQWLVLLPKNGAYVCTRWDVLGRLAPPKSLIAWVKDSWSAGDLKHEHGRQWEAIAFYPRHGHKFIKRIPDVINVPRTKNGNHPTEKPTALFKHLIGANVGETILDPFMGSGPVLRAAKDLGRQAIGIEIEERYCEIAAARLSQEAMMLVG